MNSNPEYESIDAAVQFGGKGFWVVDPPLRLQSNELAPPLRLRSGQALSPGFGEGWPNQKRKQREFRLKFKSQSKLYPARRVALRRRIDDAERRIPGSKKRIGRREARGIKGIENLGPQLQSHAFARREFFV